MKQVGLEELKRTIGQLKDSKEEIEVTYRGEPIGRFTPQFMFNRTVQNEVAEPNRTVQGQKQAQPHGSLESNRTVRDNDEYNQRLKLAREALNAPKTAYQEVDDEPDRTVEEVRIWIEDGIEYKVTADQFKRKFGKQWERWWKQAAPC